MCPSADREGTNELPLPLVPLAPVLRLASVVVELSSRGRRRHSIGVDRIEVRRVGVERDVAAVGRDHPVVGVVVALRASDARPAANERRRRRLQVADEDVRRRVAVGRVEVRRFRDEDHVAPVSRDHGKARIRVGLVAVGRAADERRRRGLQVADVDVPGGVEIARIEVRGGRAEGHVAPVAGHRRAARRAVGLRSRRSRRAADVGVQGVGRLGRGEERGDRLVVEVGGDRGGQVFVDAPVL